VISTRGCTTEGRVPRKGLGTVEAAEEVVEKAIHLLLERKQRMLRLPFGGKLAFRSFCGSSLCWHHNPPLRHDGIGDSPTPGGELSLARFDRDLVRPGARRFGQTHAQHAVFDRRFDTLVVHFTGQRELARKFPIPYSL